MNKTININERKPLFTEDLRYVVTDGTNTDSQSLALTSEIYKAWLKVWEKVFSSDTRNFKVNPDDFLRQKLLVGLYHKTNLVGFHLYSFFDLHRPEMEEHSYFHGVVPTSFEKLKTQKLFNIMTMEYLTVMPEYRKHESGILWGDVIISLGLNIMKTTPADLAFGTPRSDVKVNEMADRTGFVALQAPIQKYDYHCEVVYFPKNKKIHHPDPDLHLLITTLWNNRIDLRQNEQTTSKKASAA